MATNRPLHALITSSGSPAARSSSVLISPPVAALADPVPCTADARLVELLADEMLRTIRASARAASQRSTRDHLQINDELAALGLADPAPPAPRTPGTVPAAQEQPVSAGGEDDDGAVIARLDGMGFRVGWATAERLARDRPRFPMLPPSAPPGAPPTSSSSSSSPSPAPPAPDPLEVVKFICKDVWSALYDKQVDNLRTNHRGVYVLLDHSLRGLRTLGTPESRDDEKEAERWTRQ
ncbi:hypothetical protein JCM3770_003523, partial [Rhodotorula araucariae]